MNPATKDDLRRWFQAGSAYEDNTHMVVLCDTIDWSDQPVYVTSKERALEYMSHCPDGYKVMEVYNLKRDMEEQMAAYRAWYF